MSNISSYVYRIYFRKYQVSSLRRLSVNRRFETKISRNSFDFRVSISPHKNYRTLNFFGEPNLDSCKYVIYWKKMSKINFFDTEIEGRTILKLRIFLDKRRFSKNLNHDGFRKHFRIFLARTYVKHIILCIPQIVQKLSSF